MGAPLRARREKSDCLPLTALSLPPVIVDKNVKGNVTTGSSVLWARGQGDS